MYVCRGNIHTQKIMGMYVCYRYVCLSGMYVCMLKVCMYVWKKHTYLENCRDVCMYVCMYVCML